MVVQQAEVVNKGHVVRIKKTEGLPFFHVKKQVLLGANTPQKKLKEVVRDIKVRREPVLVLEVLESNLWH